MTFRDTGLLEWARSYSREAFFGDATAGLTVGVMVVPQSMAYAVLLGVPPIYGLYASLVPLLVYPIFGTSRQLAVGVIAIDMLVAGAGLSLVAVPGSPSFISLAIFLALLVGVTQVAMGLLRLGFVVQLLSRPVIAGFASAAAIVICFSQLGNLLGIGLPQSQYVLVILWQLVDHISEIHVVSALIGIGGIALLFGLKSWRPLFPAPVLVLALGTALAWMLRLDDSGVAVVGSIPTGLPGFDVPDVSFRSIRALLPTALTLALVQFMTVISLGKVFAARHRYRVLPNRELIAIGMANIAGSFFRSVPVSGSFSRSAINDQAGAQTPLANVFAGLVVAATLLFLTPLFRYVPFPILGAIIILAAVGLVNLGEVRRLIHLKRVDGGIALITFAATLIAGVVEGLLLGVAASVVAVLYRIGRPRITVLGRLPGTQAFGDIRRHPEAQQYEDILILRVEASLSFANAEYLRDVLHNYVLFDAPGTRAIVIDAGSINDVDTTAVEMLLEALMLLDEHGIELYFGSTKGAVFDVLDRAGFVGRLGLDHFFVTAHDAVQHALSQHGAHNKEARLLD